MKWVKENAGWGMLGGGILGGFLAFFLIILSGFVCDGCNILLQVYLPALALIIVLLISGYLFGAVFDSKFSTIERIGLCVIISIGTLIIVGYFF